MMHGSVRTGINGNRVVGGILLAVVIALGGCGQSEFSKQVTAVCLKRAGPGVDCGCVAKQLDAYFPDKLKPAFVALRFPLLPDPKDRDAVNGAMLRAAGIDPADRQQMDSAEREFRDTYYPMRSKLREKCGGAL